MRAPSALRAVLLSAAAATGAALATVAVARPPEEPSRQGSLRASALVERVLVDAYVTDGHGAALPGLGLSDFRVLVDGLEVPLEAVEWVAADRPEEPPSAEAGTPEFPPGRLIVLFFQGDFGRMRTKGQMRMANEAVLFLDRILPTDRVAVVSYDSHLKLRLDFTSDRERIRAAIFECLRYNLVPPLPPGPFPSLARHLDFQAARDAYSVERGLLATARALEAVPGAKAMLFLGWGLRVDRNPKDDLNLGLALDALRKARVTVFTLDVTDADWHTLEVELMDLAEATGGTYDKTNLFGAGALERVLRAVEGRYILTFVRPDRPRGRHRIEVELPGRKGRVLARPHYDD